MSRTTESSSSSRTTNFWYNNDLKNKKEIIAMRRKCKSCESFKRQLDGTILCEYANCPIDADDEPKFEDGLCYSRAERPQVTPEYLHAIRSESGRKGGLNGRRGRTPKIQLQVRKDDYDAFSHYASDILKMTLVDAFHEVVKEIVSENKQTTDQEIGK